MAEEITNTETVKSSSDGTVKISIEKFEELTRRANEEKNVVNNVTQIVKTNEQHAIDKVVSGDIMIAGGLVSTGLGLWVRFKGKTALRALAEGTIS